MKLFSRIFLAMAVAAFISVDIYAVQKLPTVDILGKTYYMYEIKKGDSMFGISRDFGWNYDELCRLNPKAVSPLEKGMKIYYPVENKPEGDDSAGLNTNTAEPLTHLIKRGETVYAISRMYGIPVEEIFRLNPGSNAGIRDGESLILAERKPNADSGNDNVKEFYTIKRGDTLYGVAKSNNTTVAAIMKKNPGISEKNFRAGDTILLPAEGEGLKKVVKEVEVENLTSFSAIKVGKDDTWDSLSKKTGIDKEDLIEANKGSGDKPKKKSIVAVPNIETRTVEQVIVEEDPRELTTDGISDIYEDVHGLADVGGNREFKVALLLSEPASRKDLEFTRGFLTGLDRIKKTGMKVNLTIVNGNRTSTDVLTELSDVDPDLLLLTTEKGIPAYISEYAEISQTPTVNTFDVRNELYATNPYIIQLLTPSNYFNEEIAARVAKDFGGHKLVFAGTEDDNDQLANALKDLWDKSAIRTISVDGLKSAVVKDDVRYLIYGYPTKKDDVDEFLTVVSDLKREHPLADISVIGRPSWIVYDDGAMEEKFHNSDVMIPSRFFYDKDSAQSRSFENHFKSLFDREPAKSFPMYAAVGYDASSFFVPALIKADLDINKIGGYSSGVQSDFEIYRPGNWTGMLNPVVYLVRFTPFNTIEKIIVK